MYKERYLENQEIVRRDDIVGSAFKILVAVEKDETRQISNKLFTV